MSRDLHYCRACERFNEASTCPNCGASGARISVRFAERILWSINADRMHAWIQARVVVPKPMTGVQA